jgi:hypothetical protein
MMDLGAGRGMQECVRRSDGNDFNGVFWVVSDPLRFISTAQHSDKKKKKKKKKKNR